MDSDLDEDILNNFYALTKNGQHLCDKPQNKLI